MKKIALSAAACFILLAGLLCLPKPSRAEAGITVTSPNGGQTFTQGDVVTITWSQSDIDSVTLNYVKGSGVNGIATIPVERSATTGSYQWTTPTSSIMAGSDYKIEVRGWQTGNNATVEDRSDNTFTLQPRQYAPVTVSLSPQTPAAGTVGRDTSNITIAKFNINNGAGNPTARIDIGCDLKTLPYFTYGTGLSNRIRVGDTVINSNLNSLYCNTNGVPIYVNGGETVTVSIDLSNSSQAADEQIDIYANLFSVSAQTAALENLTVQGLPVRGNTQIIPTRGSAVPRISWSSLQSNETWRFGERKTLRWSATNLPAQANNQITIGLLPEDGGFIGPLIRLPNTGFAEIDVPRLSPADKNYRLRMGIECSLAACSAHADTVGYAYISSAVVQPPVPQPQPQPQPTPTPQQPVSQPTTPQSSNSSATTASLNDQASRITQSGSNLDAFLAYRKVKRSSKDQEYAMKKLTLPLVGREKLNTQQKYAINNFIVYGAPAVQRLNARQRYELVVKFKNSNKRSPKSAEDWARVIK